MGIPVAVLGLVFFVAMLVVNLPGAWGYPHPGLRWGRMAVTLIGVGFVVYLVYTELFVLSAVCLWCTAVHVIAVALFAVVAFGTAMLAPSP
jgi:uncharacterized membrane protein